MIQRVVAFALRFRPIILASTLLVIFGYILTDISYALFDPRVRLE